jgi:hypothetical protein
LDRTVFLRAFGNKGRFEELMSEIPVHVILNAQAPLLGAAAYSLNAARSASRDRTSHFQIFPTMIRLAGYDPSWIRSRYGASLGEAPGTVPEFFVGDLHGRGSVRHWVSILPAETGSGKKP